MPGLLRLTWCRHDITITPRRRYRGVMESEVRITLRVPATLHTRLTAHARHQRRSLNSEILHLLETALDDPEAGDDPPGGSSSSAPLRGNPNSPPA
ncbi:Arc family DNA-binding protein [Streptosporangium sp. DT93]|uniref:Arc family DNA-binding protein n=1 Tax=Streptosporangium sp. DT93 TaxID=3393428 RepID=UPI003CF82C05